MHDTLPATAERPLTDTPSAQGPGASLVAASLAASLAALGASACCIVPFALMAAGIGGAWMSYFVALEPYRPALIAVTLACIGIAFHRLYVAPRRCETAGGCVDRLALRRSRATLWVVTAVLIPVLSFPYYFGYLV